MEASATEKQEIDSSTIESSDNKEGEIVTSKQRLNLEKENLIVNNFVCFFEPLIQNLDKNVDSLRLSQCELQNEIKGLLAKISKIYEDEKKKLDLDEYTKRLTVAKKRLNSIQATIMTVQDRVNRIYGHIQKDPVLIQHRQQQQLKATN